MSKNIEKEKRWDGKSKGSSKGILIFMKVIRTCGLFPAYFMLHFVVIKYALKKNEFRYFKSFRSKLGLKANRFHFYKQNLSIGYMMIDRFAHLIMKKSPFTFQNIEENKIVEALEKGKGLILLSSHIGNQEVAGDVLFERVKTTVNYFMLDNENPDVKEVIETFIEKRNVNIIPTNSDPFDMMIKIKDALERNEIVCMLGDRVMGEESFEKVDFLGKEAKFPTYPFEVALLTGSPMITAVTVKTGYKSYRQKVYDYIQMDNIPRKERQAAKKDAMVKFVGYLEDKAKENPYQWFNFYDFWNEFDATSN
jgi:predicted LPLAT superfamily acyltransferase